MILKSVIPITKDSTIHILTSQLEERMRRVKGMKTNAHVHAFTNRVLGERYCNFNFWNQFIKLDWNTQDCILISRMEQWAYSKSMNLVYMYMCICKYSLINWFKNKVENRVCKNKCPARKLKNMYLRIAHQWLKNDMILPSVHLHGAWWSNNFLGAHKNHNKRRQVLTGHFLNYRQKRSIFMCQE